MLIHRHQRTKTTTTNSESKMSRLHPSPRFLATGLFFRLKFKRLIFTRYGFLFTLAVLVVFFNEILFYQWAHWHWPAIQHIAAK